MASRLAQDSTRTSELGRRVLAAGVMIPVALGLTWVGGWAFACLVAVCGGLLAREWARVCGVFPGLAGGWLLIAGLVALILGAEVSQQPLLSAMISVGLVILTFAAVAKAAGGDRALWLAAGVVVILPAGLALVWMRGLADVGLSLIAWVLVVVWATDSAAFVVGRTFRGPLLAPRTSPGKTWSGLVGGLAGGVGASVVAAYALGGSAPGIAAMVGLLVCAAGNWGDLFASHFKRKFNVKDSGGLIPGHGGVLDRLDSLLAAAPTTAALYLAGWKWL